MKRGRNLVTSQKNLNESNSDSNGEASGDEKSLNKLNKTQKTTKLKQQQQQQQDKIRKIKNIYNKTKKALNPNINIVNNATTTSKQKNVKEEDEMAINSESDSSEEILTRLLKTNTKTLESLKRDDELCEKRLEELKIKLNSLKEDQFECNQFESQYKNALFNLETWYQVKINEINSEYDTEKSQILNEFTLKTKDLKLNLKNEFKEKLRQLEIESDLLDINTDNQELNKSLANSKRYYKLRRRSQDYSNKPIGSPSSISSSNNHVSSSSNKNDNKRDSLLLLKNESKTLSKETSTNNNKERKRRTMNTLGKISYSLNNDEINEDIKYICAL